MSYTNLLYCDKDSVELCYGNYPQEDGNEILVNKKIVDKWLEDSYGYLTYDKILNTKISIESDYNMEEFTIVGITYNDQGFMYTDKSSFLLFSSYRSTFNKHVVVRYFQDEHDGNGNKLYNVVGGRDLNPNTNDEILVQAKKYPDFINIKINEDDDLGKTVVNGVTYRIVGVFEYKYDISEKTYISNRKITTTYSTKIGSMPKSQYNIIMGRDVENKNEIIVPYYRGNKIGKTLEGKTIVGLYTGSTMAMAYSALANYDEVVLKYDASDSIFLVKNEDKFDDLMQHYNCLSYNLLDSAKHLKSKYDNSNSIFGVAYIFLFIIGIVFIYSCMRSKMISDIYKIGVYRSLGSVRSKIYKRYFIDVLVLSIITSGIGYIITTLIYYFLYSFINVYLSSIQLLFNIEYFIIFGLIMVGVMVLFGLLPIFMLLKKTPSEICAKYDI